MHNKTIALIECKGTTLPVVAVALRSLQLHELSAAADDLFGENRFFDGDAAVLDLAHVAETTDVDWRQLRLMFRTHGLHVIGVQNGSENLRQGAAAAGMPTCALSERPPRPVPAAPAQPVATSPPAPAAPPPVAAAVAPAPPVSTATATQFVNRPLRSGQQVYARGGDLVVLAAVNAGAEVIADGSIHVYAPLRGRALAGAAGAAGARILCTRFDAELVSIAGLYRTFDGGVPAELAGKAVQVRLVSESSGEAEGRLIVEALPAN